VASVLFAPGVLWSLYDSPRLKGTLLGPQVPHWIKRIQYSMSDRFFVRPLLAPQLNGLRREVGLPAVERIFSKWFFKSDMTVGLFPDWFGPRQPDWPANTKTVGFPLWDTPGEAVLPQWRTRLSRCRFRAACVFAWIRQQRSASFFRSGSRNMPTAWAARNSAHKVRSSVAVEIAGFGLPCWFRTNEPVVAPDGGADSSRRDW
jgi:hypothetical protein